MSQQKVLGCVLRQSIEDPVPGIELQIQRGFFLALGLGPTAVAWWREGQGSGKGKGLTVCPRAKRKPGGA